MAYFVFFLCAVLAAFVSGCRFRESDVAILHGATLFFVLCALVLPILIQLDDRRSARSP